MRFHLPWVEARFESRPNRFVALVEVEGELHKAHVPGTGRMRELLVPGARCLLTAHPEPSRKTPYELRLVEYGGKLVSVDSQLPNTLVAEALAGGLFPGYPGMENLKREYKWGDSRLDLAFESQGQPVLMEVKGVTLALDGWCYFPDAPTTRGTRHLEELIRAAGEGYRTAVAFVLQNPHGHGFSPHRKRDPRFAGALIRAAAAGVEVFALRTEITTEEIRCTGFLPVRLEEGPEYE